MTPTSAQNFCRYNRWMNEKLLEGCAGLTDEARKLDRGAPFKSIHGIWNHLLLTNRLWLGRFSGIPYPARGLNDEVYSDFEELRAGFRETDAEISNLIRSMTDDYLANGILRFTPISVPQPRELPVWLVVTHIFNHQTHHRGQITALMEQAGADCGITDLLMLPPDFAN